MQVTQKQLEKLLHRQHVLNAIKLELEEYCPTMIDDGVGLLQDWLDEETWPTKTARKDTIRYHDLRSIVLKIIANITLACVKGLPLVSISGMATLTDDLEKLDNIHLSAEVITLLANTGAYSLEKSVNGTYVVLSQLEPSDKLQRQIHIGCYLPPMIEKPSVIETNSDSAYLTINKDNLILGGQLNQHNEDVSLDVINMMNNIEYELDELSCMETKPFHREYLDAEGLKALPLLEQKDYEQELSNHVQRVEQFTYLCTLIKERSLRFPTKPDKRGRLYTQGYHFNPQGSSFEKSCLNLKHRELVTGDL